MFLWTTYSPESPWEGPQFTNFNQCLHIIMVNEKCTDTFTFFLVWEREGLKVRGYAGGTFFGGICHGGRKFP